MSRSYPALDVTWPLRPDDERLGVILAEVDEEGPLAVEEIESGLRIFFPAGHARGRAAVKLIALEPDLTCTPREIDDEDWAARSQASLGPVVVGNIAVTPPWLARHRDLDGTDIDAISISIQPSMGFGTGHHASTRLCLQLLQHVPVVGRSVLDVGTGSGVLAIAAAKLGAMRVLAIDTDQDALVSARENVETNRAAVTLELSGLETTRAGATFDVVLGNLTGALLARQASTLRSLLSDDGVLIVSGITAGEGTGVKAALANVGFAVGQQINEDGWIGLRLTIPTSSTGP